MKIKCALCIGLLPLVGICRGSVGNDLFSLTNDWGKGTINDFHKKVYKVAPVVEKNGGAEALVNWCQSVVAYPDMLKETGLTYWMREKVYLLSYFARITSAGSSTNCWFAAAELLNRYRGLTREAESNANVKIDYSLTKTNPKRYNELLYGKKPLEVRARNLKYVEDSLAYVVTNEFPEGVLPLLPESDRQKVMTEVLVRSGLESAECRRESFSSFRFSFVVLLGGVILLVIIGFFAYRCTSGE